MSDYQFMREINLKYWAIPFAVYVTKDKYETYVTLSVFCFHFTWWKFKQEEKWQAEVDDSVFEVLGIESKSKSVAPKPED